MIDAAFVLRAYLMGQTSLTALTGTRIWEERVTPPKGYKPSDGGAICFRSRGGVGTDYSSALLHNSWQFKCYGIDEAAANQIYRALVDVLHEAQDANIRMARLEITGQLLTEEPLGWHYNLCFFETRMLAQLPVT